VGHGCRSWMPNDGSIRRRFIGSDLSFRHFGFAAQAAPWNDDRSGPGASLNPPLTIIAPV
jgi:hypothetical protein